jgi:hypothetical protein
MTLPDDRVLRGGLRRFPLLGGGAGMARLSIFEVIHYPVLVFRYFSTRAYTNTPTVALRVLFEPEQRSRFFYKL